MAGEKMSIKNAWYHILTAQNQREEKKKSLSPWLGLENSCVSSLIVFTWGTCSAWTNQGPRETGD